MAYLSNVLYGIHYCLVLFLPPLFLRSYTWHSTAVFCLNCTVTPFANGSAEKVMAQGIRRMALQDIVIGSTKLVLD